MRVLCRSGHYSFYPRNERDISRFCSFYKVELEKENDYYTFKFLKGIKDYSIRGGLYSNAPAIKTVEGKPWEVMDANGLVYSIFLKRIVNKATITIVSNLKLANFYYISDSGLLQSGALTSQGKKIKSFDAEYYFDIHKLRIREVEYE